MFLAQIGAIAAHRAGLPSPPEDAATWQDIIGRLTRKEFPDDEPWCLAVDDWSKPAFLQPPVPDGVKWTAEVRTPDSLDMLSVPKNHDLKQSVARTAEFDDWIFGLISQQTFDGALTNNPSALQLGIARMNTGDGSRPFFGLAPVFSSGRSASLGAHLRHDLVVLMATQSKWSEQWKILYRPASDAIALAWLQPWTAPTSISFDKLDPLFVEVSRVIRLENADGVFRGRRAGSAGRRIDSSGTNGVTGDPWTPTDISKNPPTALTFGASTVHYEKLSKILFDENYCSQPICMEFHRIPVSEQTNYEIVVRGVARKRGHQTERFLKRTVSLGQLNSRKFLGSRRHEVGEFAQRQIREIKTVHNLLVSAIGVFFRGGVNWSDVPSDKKKTEGEKQRRCAQPYRDRLDAVADRAFFPALWARFEAEQQGTPDDVEAARRAFLLPLIGTARQLLEEALDGIPCRSIRRPRAEARARRRFEVQLHSDKTGFPGLFTKSVDDQMGELDAH